MVRKALKRGGRKTRANVSRKKSLVGKTNVRRRRPRRRLAPTTSLRTSRPRTARVSRSGATKRTTRRLR